MAHGAMNAHSSRAEGSKEGGAHSSLVDWRRSPVPSTLHSAMEQGPTNRELALVPLRDSSDGQTHVHTLRVSTVAPRGLERTPLREVERARPSTVARGSALHIHPLFLPHQPTQQVRRGTNGFSPHAGSVRNATWILTKRPSYRWSTSWMLVGGRSLRLIPLLNESEHGNTCLK